MSQENVEIVLALQPPADVDVAPLFREDALWAALKGSFDSLVHPTFECVNPGAPGERNYAGPEGFRSFWLDWLAPWSSYRSTTERAIDCQDRVLLLATNFGRLHGSSREVKVNAGAVYTFRDGKISRYEGYLDQAQALKSVGLEVQDV
jgi:ketosteroid isomerase-like protein